MRLEAGYNRGIQLTGHADCGPKHDSSAHQDGVQLQGGRDITFVDFTIGDYDGGRSTCQGAGGAFFYSGAGGYEPQNIDVVRGKYIACNHALLVGGGSGDVSDASFRSGRTDGTDPALQRVRGLRAVRRRRRRDPDASHLPAVEPEQRPVGRPVIGHPGVG